MAFDALETRQSRASVYGRFCDALSRRTLNIRAFDIVPLPGSPGPARPVLKKPDGYFAAADLGPVGAAVTYAVTAPGYQSRQTPPAVLLATGPAEITAAGEDEEVLFVTGVDPVDNRVDFEPLLDVPRIEAGATVLGDGVATVLAEPLEGRAQTFADLDDVTGIAIGAVLRVVRSTRLALRPSATAAVPAGTTTASFTVVETGPDQTPVVGALVTLSQVNGAAPTSVISAGLTIHRAVDPGPPAAPFTLGPPDALLSETDTYGRAAFHFVPGLPVQSLDVSITRPGFVPAAAALPLVPGGRAALTVTLTPS